jgi:regulator of ribonuclease activity A
VTHSRKKRGGLSGETLGGILAGFDQQIMRTTPPAHELVQKGSPLRGIASDDAGDLTITLPERPDPAEGRMPATSDLLDADPEGYDVCEAPLVAYGAVRRFAGRVRTVRCHEDNVLLRGLLETPGSGQVLVVDGGGSRRTALLGDMVASLAVATGWVGVVVNGCVRDVAALAVAPIGIQALAANPRRSSKAGAGEVDVHVTFAGATFRPGAILVCDEDGLIVTRDVPPA